MSDFKQFDLSILKELGGLGYNVDPGHPQIGKILDEIKANPDIIACSGKDYMRTYTKAEYTRYDKTQSGFVGNGLDDLTRNVLSGPEIGQILNKYGVKP